MKNTQISSPFFLSTFAALFVVILAHGHLALPALAHDIPDDVASRAALLMHEAELSDDQTNPQPELPAPPKTEHTLGQITVPVPQPSVPPTNFAPAAPPVTPPAAISAPQIPAPTAVPATAAKDADHNVEKTSSNAYPHTSGGISAEDREEMLSHQKDYNLKMIFVGVGGIYLTDTVISITNKSGTVLDATSDGPWFYASLPEGKYSVTATTEGKVLKQKISVGKTLRTYHFRYPIKDGE